MYAEEAVKLLNRAQLGAAEAGERRPNYEGNGSPATATEDPASLLNIINMLTKKTQQLQD